jgi:hypothetical protein
MSKKKIIIVAVGIIIVAGIAIWRCQKTESGIRDDYRKS